MNAHLKQKSLAAWRFVARRRCTPLILIAAACLLIEEQYPFSHFPMYSSFGPSTYYVYLTDGSEKPLPSYQTLGISTGTLKKLYQAELRREAERVRASVSRLTHENKRAVAQRILARFREAAAKGRIGGLPSVLRLYEVQIRLGDAKLRKERKLIAEMQ